MDILHPSDAALLIMVVGLFYLWECIRWLPKDTVCFISLTGECCPRHVFGTLFGNDRGGLAILSLLPGSRSILAQQWPVSMSPDGVLAYVSQSLHPTGRPTQTELFFEWRSIRSIRAIGRDVIVNDIPFVHTCSPAFADHLASVLHRIGEAPRKERESIIEDVLHEMLDSHAAVERLAHYHQETAVLAWLNWTMFVLTFIAAPLLLCLNAISRSAAACLDVLPCLYAIVWLLNIAALHRADRTLYPSQPAGRNWQRPLSMLSPATAMKSADILFRELLPATHPLVIAHTSLPQHKFRELARRVLLDIRHPVRPVCQIDNELACRTEAWFRERMLAAMNHFIESLGEHLDDLLRPPTREGSDARSYCPRCDGQYTLDEGTCQQCGGIPLRRFLDTEEEETRGELSL